jgi:hypothetical protein
MKFRKVLFFVSMKYFFPLQKKNGGNYILACIYIFKAGMKYFVCYVITVGGLGPSRTVAPKK